MGRKLYYLPNARLPEQAQEMERLQEAGICVFCPAHLLANEGPHIEHLAEHWTAVRNRYPYEGTKIHLLLVPRLHVSEVADLPDVAQLEFFKVVRTLQALFGISGHGLALRNGDPVSTGATIYHLHAHFIVADETPGAVSPKFRVGYAQV